MIMFRLNEKDKKEREMARERKKMGVMKTLLLWRMNEEVREKIIV